jgi:hypothetical protein
MPTKDQCFGAGKKPAPLHSMGNHPRRQRAARIMGTPLALAGALAGVSLAGCDGTPTAGQVTVVAGEQHLTFSPAPPPSGTPVPTPPTVAFTAQAFEGGGETEEIEFRAGPMSLTVDGIRLEQIGGSDEFEVLSDDCTRKVLAPGEACHIQVRFNPLTTGVRDAELVLMLGSRAPAVELSLEGRGVTTLSPSPTASPSPTPTPTTATPTPTPTQTTPTPTPTATDPSTATAPPTEPTPTPTSTETDENPDSPTPSPIALEP